MLFENILYHSFTQMLVNVHNFLQCCVTFQNVSIYSNISYIIKKHSMLFEHCLFYSDTQLLSPAHYFPQCCVSFQIVTIILINSELFQYIPYHLKIFYIIPLLRCSQLYMILHIAVYLSKLFPFILIYILDYSMLL